MTAIHGAHLRRDLVAKFGEHTLRVALRDGLFEQPWRGVIITRDQATRLETRAAAALLAVGDHAVLSGATAAALHGCTAAAECTDVHLTIPNGRRARSRRGLVVHNDQVEPGDVTTRLGMPVFVLDHVIAELLCTAPRRLALACADQALAALPQDQRIGFHLEVCARLDRRGDRRGTSRGEVLLNLATGQAESPPESWLMLLVADAGLPLPQPQVEVRDLEGQLVYRLDLAWPDLRIALEYDGYEAHELRTEGDAERDRRLGGRGWLVIRARAADIRQPGRLIGDLRKAFATRGAASLLREGGARLRERGMRLRERDI
jgi:hypothetical protein